MNRSVVGWLVGSASGQPKTSGLLFPSSFAFRSSPPPLLSLYSLSLSRCILAYSLFRTLSSKKKKNQRKKKKKSITMFPQQWSSPCGNQCTNKYSALMQIPWRVFCKKGCNADGDTWEECLEECEEICYKDPVLKDHQWSAYIDRSPGADKYSAIAIVLSPCGQWVLLDQPASFFNLCHNELAYDGNCSILDHGYTYTFKSTIYSSMKWLHSVEECFHACVAGCGYKFDVPSKTVDQVHPNRPTKPCIESKPPPSPVKQIPPSPVGQVEDAEDMPSTSA